MKLRDEFAALGIDLRGFYLENVSPTEETQKAIDERASMGAIGDMQAYLQYKAARAMGDAAQNQGSGGDMTGAGFGLGAGVGMGAMMAQILGQSVQQRPQQRPAAETPRPQASGPAAPSASRPRHGGAGFHGHRAAGEPSAGGPTGGAQPHPAKTGSDGGRACQAGHRPDDNQDERKEIADTLALAAKASWTFSFARPPSSARWPRPPVASWKGRHKATARRPESAVVGAPLVGALFV